MTAKTDTIEVDKTTADRLKARAAERGMSVSELLAELASESSAVGAESAEIAELDRRWAKVKAGAPMVPHGDVVRWLDSWGTPTFRPWRER